MTLRLIVPPTDEPLSLAEAKLHLRETETDQDPIIVMLIKAAREYAENLMRRAVCTQTLELDLEEFPSAISLPRPPLQSVTYIKYVDIKGVTQTLDPSVYQIDSYREPALVKPAFNQYWPALRGGDFNAVQVRYIAGWVTASPMNIPESLRQWMRVRVGQLYENREATIVGTIVQPIQREFVDGLLDSLIVNLLSAD